MSNQTELNAKMPDVIYVSVPEKLHACEDPWLEDNNCEIQASIVYDEAAETGSTAIKYLKAEDNGGKIVLLAKWEQSEKDKTIFSYKIGEKCVAWIADGGGQYQASIQCGLNMYDFFKNVEEAVGFVRVRVTHFFEGLSPEIIVTHDDEYPEFK
jgi:hypothetical protein